MIQTNTKLEAPGMDGDAYVICTHKSQGKRRTVAHAYSPEHAALFAAAPDHLAASRSTVDRLADLPRLLRQAGHKAIASIVEEELAAHRAAISMTES